MKRLLCLLLVFSLFGCSQQEKSNYEKLSNDAVITQSFTDAERQNLAKILDFVEDQICKDSKEISPQLCYEALLIKDSIKSTQDGILRVLDYQEQKILYKELDSSFINDLWSREGEKFINRYVGDSLYTYKYESFHLKPFGSKYANFLEKFAQQNEYVKHYLERARVPGEFYTPYLSVYMSIDYRKFDFSDIKIQLLYAFYYLDINENNIHPYDKAEKWLQKLKEN